MSDITDAVILEPMPLVESIVSGVVAMWNSKFKYKFLVLEAGRIMTHGVLEGHVNETPFASCISANAIRDEEELIRAPDNGCGEVADSRD